MTREVKRGQQEAHGGWGWLVSPAGSTGETRDRASNAAEDAAGMCLLVFKGWCVPKGLCQTLLILTPPSLGSRWSDYPHDHLILTLGLPAASINPHLLDSDSLGTEVRSRAQVCKPSPGQPWWRVPGRPCRLGQLSGCRPDDKVALTGFGVWIQTQL